MEKPKPKERAQEVVKMFSKGIKEKAVISNPVKFAAVQCSVLYQEGIINKLKEYSIVSEYEQEVLNELKK